MFVFVFLSVCLSFQLSNFLCVYLLSAYLSVCLSFQLSIFPTFYLSNSLPFYLSISIILCLSDSLSFLISVFLSVYLSGSLSFWLSIFLALYLSDFLSFLHLLFLFVYVSACLIFCLSIFLSVPLSVCLSFWIPIWLSPVFNCNWEYQTHQKIPASVSLKLLPHDDCSRKEIHCQVDNCKPVLFHEEEGNHQDNVDDLVSNNGQCFEEKHNSLEVGHLCYDFWLLWKKM